MEIFSLLTKNFLIFTIKLGHFIINDFFRYDQHAIENQKTKTYVLQDRLLAYFKKEEWKKLTV